jgi:hypothetical protein
MKKEKEKKMNEDKRIEERCEKRSQFEYISTTTNILCSVLFIASSSHEEMNS